jgi:predicted esterase
VEKEGPFDGLLGFSQGAAAAALLLACHPTWFRCALLVAGFVPLDPTLAAALEGRRLPHACLLVSGETDTLVPSYRGEQLAACFEHSERFVHAGGHGLPSNAQFRSAAKDFFEVTRRAQPS